MGRKRFNGCCGLCGVQETSRWYRKKIENMVICKSCYDKANRQQSDYKEHRYLNRARWGATFNGAKNSARARKLEFTLTQIEWESKTQICYYCDAIISHLTGTKLDRIDSKLPYTNENTVGCCKRCNVAKNNMTLDEFKKWIITLYNKIMR